MPTSSIEVRRYTGPLLGPDLLSGQKTLLLSTFTAPTTGALADDEGTLELSDNSVSRFDGNALTYVGSGTVRAGITVAGLIVPTGPAVDVVAFEVGGQIYFHFPDGPPGALSIVAMIIDIDTTPYEVFPNPYIGGPGADTFTGDAFGNTMLGNGGNDTIAGGAGNDSIGGGLGADSLLGGDGNDFDRRRRRRRRPRRRQRPRHPERLGGK